MPRHLLVAIHDVTPAHATALERIYRLLETLGIMRYALLVVPDWHGEWPLDRHAAFVDDLVRRQAHGAEIFLHGYRHDEAGARRSFSDRLRVAGRTRSAEFFLIPPDEAARRLDRGLALFERLELKPVGFIPPGWLHGPRSLALLAERQLDITEGFWRITRVPDRRHFVAPALSWSSAAPSRTYLTAGIAAARRALERRRALVRAAPHPPDILIPVIAQSLRVTLEDLRGYREETLYREIVKRER